MIVDIILGLFFFSPVINDWPRIYNQLIKISIMWLDLDFDYEFFYHDLYQDIKSNKKIHAPCMTLSYRDNNHNLHDD